MRGVRVAVFVVTVAVMLAVACLLVGLGFGFLAGEMPEPPSTATTPSWGKYVCWSLAGLTAVAALPTGLVLSRVVLRRAR